MANDSLASSLNRAEYWHCLTRIHSSLLTWRATHSCKPKSPVSYTDSYITTRAKEQRRLSASLTRLIFKRYHAARKNSSSSDIRNHRRGTSTNGNACGDSRLP